ncbi:uncharacterized protein MONBRDRAFT_27123 [Monosiga brevicollis MX1]|uniref:receptor protein-tyrosine kinase n=1 Tax=Monosiga brevicollis TaxID=81824 RepID=A9V4D1_MONBE|nr:uncharacterized protein MONBRDRAFT_27123 [Monosiga brevicollis MX1]EDQ87595.1 predicted protein [Monosiga brevicollis MX1]|eukprot:XP_001747515.1 hypothetical protein [Monosiga brevicollis MX1]
MGHQARISAALTLAVLLCTLLGHCAQACTIPAPEYTSNGTHLLVTFNLTACLSDSHGHDLLEHEHFHLTLQPTVNTLYGLPPTATIPSVSGLARTLEDVTIIALLLATNVSSPVSRSQMNHTVTFAAAYCTATFSFYCLAPQQYYSWFLTVDDDEILVTSPADIQIPEALEFDGDIYVQELTSTSANLIVHAHTDVAMTAEVLVWFSQAGNSLSPYNSVQMSYGAVVNSSIHSLNTSSGHAYQVSIQNLVPFTHYRVQIFLLLTNLGTYRSVNQNITTRAALGSDQQRLTFSSIEVSATNAIIALQPPSPDTGVIHAIELAVLREDTNVTTTLVYLNGVSTSLSFDRNHVEARFMIEVSDLAPYSNYSLRARFVLDGAISRSIVDQVPPELGELLETRNRRADLSELLDSQIAYNYTGLSPETPALLSAWTDLVQLQTAVAIPSAVQLSRVYTEEVTALIQLRWDAVPITAPGNMILILHYYNRENLDTSVREQRPYPLDHQIILNERDFYKLGVREIAVSVANIVGESEVSNHVAFIATGHDSIWTPYLMAVVILVPIVVVVLVFVAVWYHRRRVLEEQIVSFPPPDKWELNAGELILGRQLGKGEFGIVHHATYLDDVMAVKELRPGATSSQARSFIEEALIMKQLTESGGHMNVMPLIGVTMQAMPLRIVVPYMQSGSLSENLRTSHLINPEFFDLRQRLYFAMDIALGMEFLAEQQVVHRDLATRNVLLTENWVGVVADFGLAREVKSFSRSNRQQSTGYYRKTGEVIAAVRWMPPEVFTSGVFEELSDVWAFGVTVWEIFSWAALPYEELNHDNVISEVLKGVRLKQPEEMPTIIFMLLQRCWNPERPRFSTIASFLRKAMIKFQMPYLEGMERVHPEERLESADMETRKASHTKDPLEHRQISEASAQLLSTLMPELPAHEMAMMQLLDHPNDHGLLAYGAPAASVPLSKNELCDNCARKASMHEREILTSMLAADARLPLALAESLPATELPPRVVDSLRKAQREAREERLAMASRGPSPFGRRQSSTAKRPSSPGHFAFEHAEASRSHQDQDDSEEEEDFVMEMDHASTTPTGPAAQPRLRDCPGTCAGFGGIERTVVTSFFYCGASLGFYKIQLDMNMLLLFGREGELCGHFLAHTSDSLPVGIVQTLTDHGRKGS